MAIDDNTLYGVTGAQIKDLAERVKDGGVKVIYTDFELCHRTNGDAHLYYDRDYTQPVTGAELREMYDKGPVALASKSWYEYMDDIFLLINRSNGGDESDFFSYWVQVSNEEAWELMIWDDENYASAYYREPADTFTLTQTSQTPTPQTAGTFRNVLYQQTNSTNKYDYDFYLLKEYNRLQNTRVWEKIAFDTDIPTDVSALTNDAGYQNATQVSSAISTAISGISGSVKELTVDDFNYPANNPDGVALWMLDTGIYYTTTSIKVYFSTSDHTLFNEFFMVSPKSSNNMITIFELSSERDNIRKITVTDAGGLMFAGRTALWNTQVKNDLTTPSTDNGYILDARQGKVLKDMIDATSADTPVITLTATDPGEGATLAENHFIGVY